MLTFMVWFVFINTLASFGVQLGRVDTPKPHGVYGAGEALISLLLAILWGIALYLHYS